MNRPSSPPFDFDAWMALAKSDPPTFEAKRREEIEKFISQAPSHLHRRLRGLQWQVDMERQRHERPMGACVTIFNMMWEKVYGEDGLRETLYKLHDEETDTTSPSLPAEVLEFKSPSA